MRPRSRSVHNFGTCVLRTAAQWRLPKKGMCFDAGKIGFCHCAAVLLTQVPKLCTDLHLSHLYILIQEKYGKFARENNFPSARRLLFAALLERWPQVCRVKITFEKLPTDRFVSTRSHLKNYRQIVSFPQQKIRRNAL